MNKNSLSTNEEMLHGEFLTSLNGKYRAVFQIDCNLVIYGETARWHSDTAQTTGVRLVLQDNGTLVMYTSKKTSVWETGNKISKEFSQRMRLTLTDSGNLELTRDGELTWTSANSKGVKM